MQVVNIMLMLGLISSVAFSIYAVDVSLFWERAEARPIGLEPMKGLYRPYRPIVWGNRPLNRNRLL